MANYLFVPLFLLIAAVTGKTIMPANVNENFVKARIYKDFITKLQTDSGELQVSISHNTLKLYSHSTMEQAQQVVDYIQTHDNLTREESRSLRMAGNSSIQISDCIMRGERKIIESYKLTGFNLHNCIRGTQISFEKLFVELIAKIDTFKSKALLTFNRYNATVDNCVDQHCLMTTLADAIVEYERLNEELEQIGVEGNNLNSRYLITSIAMTCVSNSLTQIHQNYNTGKELQASCFHVHNQNGQNQNLQNGQNQIQSNGQQLGQGQNNGQQNGQSQNGGQAPSYGQQNGQNQNGGQAPSQNQNGGQAPSQNQNYGQQLGQNLNGGQTQNNKQQNGQNQNYGQQLGQNQNGGQPQNNGQQNGQNQNGGQAPNYGQQNGQNQNGGRPQNQNGGQVQLPDYRYQNNGQNQQNQGQQYQNNGQYQRPSYQQQPLAQAQQSQNYQYYQSQRRN